VASPALRPLWDEARRRAGKLEGFEIRHTLRGGNQEADRLANEAMDKGTGRGPGSGTGSVPGPISGRTASPKTPSDNKSTPGASKSVEGYVQGGVVHLLDGAIPDGTFVTVHLKG
ncbi:MAG: ribonuclease HI, partial [Acidobacteriota bacterium]|nr:ribonuclease HI [Acidobacteriota bacterium]